MFRFRVIAAGTLVGLFAVIAAAVPASAHDELLSSTPTVGEALVAAPDTVSLEFSADVLTLGAAIVVADSEGRDWVAGDPVIEAGVVSAPLAEGMPEAGYEVRWRVVSGDGHPIAGVIPFTIGAGAPLVRDSPTPVAAQTASTQSAPLDGPPRLVIIGVAGAALAAGLVALTLLFLRRRTRSAAPTPRLEASASDQS